MFPNKEKSRPLEAKLLGVISPCPIWLSASCKHRDLWCPLILSDDPFQHGKYTALASFSWYVCFCSHSGHLISFLFTSFWYHFYISNISLQRSKEIRRFSTTKTICRDESTILIWTEIWWFAPAFNGYNSWIFIARIHRLSWNSFVSDSTADDWTTSATQRLLNTKTSVKENDSRTPGVFEGITSKNCFGCLKITTFFALFLVGISVRGIWIPHQTPLDDPDLPQKGRNSSRKHNHWPIKVYANCCYRQ